MLILGISGGFDTIYSLAYNLPFWLLHDAAAVLLDNGRLVAAVEQERLDRIKHSNRSALSAAKECLKIYGADFHDVHGFAFSHSESWATGWFEKLFDPADGKPKDFQSLLGRTLECEFGQGAEFKRLHYTDHHLAHSVCAFSQSAFDHSLVLSIDGAGDDKSGLISIAKGNLMQPLREISLENSLGMLYLNVIRYIGFGLFEEYKVMGLAPYGDSSRFRDLFRTFYELRPEGEFHIFTERIAVLRKAIEPRKKGTEITSEHSDVAAALQECLEAMVMHLLSWFRRSAGESNLCMAGGVALNATLNGKILRSGLFGNLFVHPAAHDAGAALGAAIDAHLKWNPGFKPFRLEHLYLGRDIPVKKDLFAQLKAWHPLVKVEMLEDPCRATAELLAAGKVVAWMQGRSEFGPRALGNRSILADPRPSANKTRINEMVKKREEFRPFAPSVTEDFAAEFFEMPSNARDLPYMIVVVYVRKEKRNLLGAVTHIDGTARIQTVSPRQNLLFSELLSQFRELTGIPILLNTSFNNNCEPIVDGVFAAIQCYLTTGLDYLVIGQYLISRNDISDASYLAMSVTVPDRVAIREINDCQGRGQRGNRAEIYMRPHNTNMLRIGRSTCDLLKVSCKSKSIAELASVLGLSALERNELLADLKALWQARYICIAPVE